MMATSPLPIRNPILQTGDPLYENIGDFSEENSLEPLLVAA